MRHAIASSVLVALATLLPAKVALAETAFLCGDVNLSDTRTAADALTILRYAVGQSVSVECGPLAPPLRTGETDCYNDAGDAVTCAGTHQDADADKGVSRKFKDLGDGTILDETTSLQWEEFSSDGGIHDRFHGGNWGSAFQKAMDLNNANFAGHNDWRVPNVFELATLLDFGRRLPTNFDPAIVAPAFDHDCVPGCAAPACSCPPAGAGAWTSTTVDLGQVSVGLVSAWVVHFDFGGVLEELKTSDFSGRVVRGGYLAVSATLLTPAPQRGRSVAVNSSCADVTHDGIVGVSDALAVLRSAVGQAVSLGCSARGGPLRTGQTTCSTADGIATVCQITSEDGAYKAGVTRSYVDNGDGTITDQSTGLTWEKLTMDSSIHNFSAAYSWSIAMVGKMGILNAANFAGHNDWRLPNVFELLTLIDYGQSQPATSPGFVSNCVQGCTALQCNCAPYSDMCWSSTTNVTTPKGAWGVAFSSGILDGDQKNVAHNARAVRGGR